ncbi:histidinol-phosphatase [Magnetospira sp. QH-2]|uniref:histidinol-phosphatase n=1 Tax=Magnetospira sp. (strain QH-2) TaxID=1288970 RepID=UPI0005F9EAF3|nr:histidinol-phosphatase [Magnetospira sp. QH-2]
MDRVKEDICRDEMIDLANRAADAAAEVIMGFYRSGVTVEDKADTSPVTIADRKAEMAIRQMLAQEVPDHGILGEEHGAHDLEAEFVWVLDPIDGTKAFICGQPTFGTLIALMRWGRPVLGVINHPALNERWVGAFGHGTTFNGSQVKVRDCGGLDKAALFTTDPEMFTGDLQSSYDALAEKVKLRRFGVDCYAYGLLASGHIDLVCEALLQPYDYLAPAAVVENAGGLMTDWQGNPLGLNSDGRVLASGSAANHQAALDLIQN